MLKLILLAWSLGALPVLPAVLLTSFNSNYCFSICSYVPNPVLVIIDVQPKELGIPTKAYYAVEEVKEVCLWSEKLECFISFFSV